VEWIRLESKYPPVIHKSTIYDVPLINFNPKEKPTADQVEFDKLLKKHFPD